MMADTASQDTSKDDPKPGEAAPLHGDKEETFGDNLKTAMTLMTMLVGFRLLGSMNGPDKGLGNILGNLFGGLDAADPAVPASPAVAATAPKLPTPGGARLG